MQLHGIQLHLFNTTVRSLCIVLLALLLLRVSREQRRSVLTVLWFFGLCMFLELGSWILRLTSHTALALHLRELCLLGHGFCLIRLIAIAGFRVLLPLVHLASPYIVQDLVVAGLAAGWFAWWMRALGADLQSMITSSAIVTAVIGLSLQDTLGNIIGGVALQLEESIQVGDWIKIDDVVGRVTDVRWRHTAIETRNWETVLIPNSQLLKNRFAILGRRQGQPVQWRRWVWLDVDFRQAPANVIETVLAGLRQATIRGVAADPPPSCVLMELGDSYAKYAVRYFLTDLQQDDVTDSIVRSHVFFALKRAGIPLSMPAQAVFLTHDTEERRRQKQERSLEARVRAVGHVSLFSGLKAEELESLARRLVPTPFLADEIMTRQGAQAHWLYVIIEGRADVVVQNSTGHSVTLLELGPGSFFGEMALLTGCPRTATVIAKSTVDCYRLDKEAFEGILRSRPALAAEISDLLHVRLQQLKKTLKELDAEAAAKSLEGSSEDLLVKIQRFFGLEG